MTGTMANEAIRQVEDCVIPAHEVMKSAMEKVRGLAEIFGEKVYQDSGKTIKRPTGFLIDALDCFFRGRKRRDTEKCFDYPLTEKRFLHLIEAMDLIEKRFGGASLIGIEVFDAKGIMIDICNRSNGSVNSSVDIQAIKDRIRRIVEDAGLSDGEKKKELSNGLDRSSLENPSESSSGVEGDSDKKDGFGTDMGICKTMDGTPCRVMDKSGNYHYGIVIFSDGSNIVKRRNIGVCLIELGDGYGIPTACCGTGSAVWQYCTGSKYSSLWDWEVAAGNMGEYSELVLRIRNGGGAGAILSSSLGVPKGTRKCEPIKNDKFEYTREMKDFIKFFRDEMRSGAVKWDGTTMSQMYEGLKDKMSFFGKTVQTSMPAREESAASSRKESQTLSFSRPKVVRAERKCGHIAADELCVGGLVAIMCRDGREVIAEIYNEGNLSNKYMVIEGEYVGVSGSLIAVERLVIGAKPNRKWKVVRFCSTRKGDGSNSELVKKILSSKENKYVPSKGDIDSSFSRPSLWNGLVDAGLVEDMSSLVFDLRISCRNNKCGETTKLPFHVPPSVLPVSQKAQSVVEREMELKVKLAEAEKDKAIAEKKAAEAESALLKVKVEKEQKKKGFFSRLFGR